MAHTFSPSIKWANLRLTGAGSGRLLGNAKEAENNLARWKR
jgi:hypothetical protein